MPGDTAQRSCHFTLRWSLQSLAAAGSEQPTRFPEHMMKDGDRSEVVDDVAGWRRVLRGLERAYEKASPRRDAKA
jgi:hypothetical protein